MAAQPPASGRNNPRRIARDRVAAAPANARGRETAASENAHGREATAPEDARGRETAASKNARPSEATAPEAVPRRAPSRRAARPRKRWHVVVTCVVIVVVLVAGLVVGGFAYLRWFASDDGADIQGTWYLAGTATPITITENRICLTDDVSYPYALDEGAKTIQFSFSNLAGAGCYRFSLDRQQLALVDGQFSGADTLGRDIGWMAQALIAHLQGSTLPPAEEAGKGLTLLSREPAKGASGTSSAKEKETEKKAEKDPKDAAKGSEDDEAGSAKETGSAEGTDSAEGAGSAGSADSAQDAGSGKDAESATEAGSGEGSDPAKDEKADA